MAYKHTTLTALLTRYGAEIIQREHSVYTEARLNGRSLRWRTGHTGYISYLQQWAGHAQRWDRWGGNPLVWLHNATRREIRTQWGPSLAVYTVEGEPAWCWVFGERRLPTPGSQEYVLVESILRGDAPIEVLADWCQDNNLLP